jgi:hypothetical protein
MEPRETDSSEAFIDYDSKSDQELKEILTELLSEERDISYRRRMLHGKIDILRAEIVARKKHKLQEGESLFTEEDIDKLSAILAGKVDELKND